MCTYTQYIDSRGGCDNNVHSFSSGMAAGAVDSTGVWMSVSDTLFLKRLSFDLVAIIVVSMAPCTHRHTQYSGTP